MKYYLQTKEYTLCKDEIYIQVQGVNENGYIEPVSAFCINYMSYGEIEDFYHIYITSNLEKLKAKELKEITKEEFNKALLKGEDFKAILLQNPEIAILESAKDKMYSIFN